MAIAKKPTVSRPADAQADKFIAGAGAPVPAPEAEEGRRTPVMIRFDKALLKRVDAAAKKSGTSRAAWIQYVVSEHLEEREG